MKLIYKVVLMVVVVISLFVYSGSGVKAIDNTRNDLGILDSLKITNNFGYEIAEGSQIHNGEQYTLTYKFSLDEPTSDYQNKLASFVIPDIFKSDSLNPAPMKLMFNDGVTSYEIGTVTANLSTGKIDVQFNNSSVLGSNSNITGWISLTATADATTGEHNVVVSWNGSNEASIKVNVDNGYVGPDREAQLNKYISSGLQPNGQPTVKQKQDGSFYITFMIEVFVSKDYSDLTVVDDIYSGLRIDDSSVKVISRPKDGAVYYSSSNNVYKTNYDLWNTNNPTGIKSLDRDMTADLNAGNKIQVGIDGLSVNFNNVDFDSELVSKQLTTVPLQLRYKLVYDTILTNIDPNLSLSEAQTEFESQNARNDAKLLSTNTVINETKWIKSALGGGATGETRSVLLSKQDAETNQSLTGAVFNLYKQNAYDTNLWELYKANVSVDSSQVNVSGLTFGNYRFQEVVAPNGYVLPDQPFASFTIDASTDVAGLSVILNNTKIIEYGAMQFEKVDSQDSSIKLQATFEVHRQDNDALVTTITTNSSGIGSVQNLEVGNYYLVETVAPTDYVIDTTRHNFTVTKDATNQVYTGNSAIKNTKIIEYGALQFEKVDSQDSSIKLQATFEVHRQDNDALVTTITTNSSGIGSVQNLEVGNYYLVETVAPTDYVIDTTKHNFTVTKDTTNQVYIGNSAIKNTKIIEYGALQFEKVDSQDSSIKLQATFEVHRQDNDALVTTITTNSSGIGSVQNLEVGNYYLVETVAPTDYEIDTTKHNFTVTKDTTNQVYIGNSAIKNTKIIEYGALQFEKVDSQDSSIKLQATFEVHRQDNDALVTTITTNSSGIGSVQNLEVGNYYLVETVAPTDYEIDTTRHNFTVTKDATNQVYTGNSAIKNTKKSKNESKVPKTGVESLTTLIAGLVTAGSAALIVLNRRRKSY